MRRIPAVWLVFAVGYLVDWLLTRALAAWWIRRQVAVLDVELAAQP